MFVLSGGKQQKHLVEWLSFYPVNLLRLQAVSFSIQSASEGNVFVEDWIFRCTVW